MGRVWSSLVHQVVPLQVADTQCGFKLFRREAAIRIFQRLRSRGFVFHVEALALAQQMGLSVAEIPVTWWDVPGSRVRLLRDPLHMVYELVTLSLRKPPRARMSGHQLRAEGRQVPAGRPRHA